MKRQIKLYGKISLLYLHTFYPNYNQKRKKKKITIIFREKQIKK